MDKKTLSSYGWVVIVIIIICILIGASAPVVRLIRANIEGVVGNMQDIGENAWDNDAPADFGDLSYIKDTRTGPVLLPQQTWYKGTTPIANITQIDILKEYTPEGTLAEPAWNADVGDTGKGGRM